MLERKGWKPLTWIIILVVVTAFVILLIGFVRSARETSIRIRREDPAIVRDTTPDTADSPAPRADTALQQ